MPTRPPTHRPRRPPSARCDARPTAARRGYSWRWQRERQWFLTQPENVLCATPGCNRLATVVDHKVPHRGDPGLFWDRSNWQGLCGACHNRKTAAGQ